MSTSLTEAALWNLVNSALRRYMQAAPAIVTREDETDWLVLSGEPVADFNYVHVEDGPEGDERLRSYARVIEAAGVPALLLFAPETSREMLALASELGAQDTGMVYPLMTFSPAAADGRDGARNRAANRLIIRPVETGTELRAAKELLSAAFGIALEPINRVCSLRQLADPCITMYVAWQDGRPMSTVTAVDDGSVTGIWSMGTPPDRQRQGAGQALLTRVMDAHAARGATCFYLGATPPGKPLYDRVGFVTAVEAPVWIIGATGDAPAH